MKFCKKRRAPKNQLQLGRNVLYFCSLLNVEFCIILREEFCKFRKKNYSFITTISPAAVVEKSG